MMAKIDLTQLITAEQKAALAKAAMRGLFQSAVQAHVDAAARSRQYADGNALASYAASAHAQWAAEAQAFIGWRDAVWLYAYQQLAEAEAGERPVPETTDAFISELPAIGWPTEEGEQ